MLDGGKTNTDGLSDPMLALPDFLFVLKSLEWGRILTGRNCLYQVHIAILQEPYGRSNSKTSFIRYKLSRAKSSMYCDL